MKTKLSVTFVVTSCVVLLVSAAFGADAKTTKIGVYNSRSVALAWGRSAQHGEAISNLVAQAKQAEAAGNQAALQKLKKEGASRQERLELQVFGDQRIPDVMDAIAPALPALSQKAGVEKIVDQRDAPAGATTVDVTDLLVAHFQPTDKTLKMIEEMKKHPPVKNVPKH